MFPTLPWSRGDNERQGGRDDAVGADPGRAGVGVVLNDQIVYANPAAQLLSERSLIGYGLEDLFVPDDIRTVMDIVQSQPVVPVQVRIAGREPREVAIYAAHALHEGSHAVQLTLQDEQARQALLQERLRVQMAEEVNQVLRQEITEHRRTQEALRHSRRFARSLVDSSLDMIMAADPDGLITEYNPAAQMRFGYEVEEIIGAGHLHELLMQWMAESRAKVAAAAERATSAA